MFWKKKPTDKSMRKASEVLLRLIAERLEFLYQSHINKLEIDQAEIPILIAYLEQLVTKEDMLVIRQKLENCGLLPITDSWH